MMARLQINKDERIATATQNPTKIASANQANATMESQMQTLLTHVQDPQLANTPNHGSNYSRGRGCRHRRGVVRGHGSVRPSAPPTPKYCWTHDNCGHGSKEYTHPSDREKKEASFAHMMSGRTNRCYNITE